MPGRLEIIHIRNIESWSAPPEHVHAPLPHPPARPTHCDTQLEHPVRGQSSSAVLGRCVELQALRSLWTLKTRLRFYPVLFVGDLWTMKCDRRCMHIYPIYQYTLQRPPLPIHSVRPLSRIAYFHFGQVYHCIFFSVVGRLLCAGACLPADWRMEHEAACTSTPCSPRHYGNVATPPRYLVVA